MDFGLISILSVIVFGVTGTFVILKLDAVDKIARQNAHGQVLWEKELYAKSEAEAVEHLRIQESMFEQSGGQPFYCNTFTGWRKKVYDSYYKKAIRQGKRRVMKQASKGHKRKLADEAKRVSELQLESRLHANVKNMKGAK